METIKIIAIFILSVILGFGAWYVILWFLTSSNNPLEWHWAIKIIYLILGFTASNNIADSLCKS